MKALLKTLKVLLILATVLAVEPCLAQSYTVNDLKDLFYKAGDLVTYNKNDKTCGSYQVSVNYASKEITTVYQNQEPTKIEYGSYFVIRGQEDLLLVAKGNETLALYQGVKIEIPAKDFSVTTFLAIKFGHGIIFRFDIPGDYVYDFYNLEKKVWEVKK